ncbi:Por secretion system C-terminal sorting domain-containing protein [Lishizhenia tianjinensis]|uniref:Por secretion system C-terminal sorting domain-containing protein n=1 Tax=Lishizhenia tianjinensis TaxID=477690 RepID=A0A1I6Z000_9FLAO|nr:T9SS type A sorting domain-containing protein [Lishizhenia tianjinensis]SFT56070.1 Por secretion system C-terminal sorting domain-containing protein [Lishizhenia tianjinensis]
MVFIKYSFVLLSVFLGFTLSAQISFHRIYAGDDYDYGYDLFQMEDTSYYLCGASSSFQDGPSQAILLKVDSLGNSIWSRNYGGSGQEAFLAMDRAGDYGIYAGGYSSSSNTSGGFDGYLARLDFDGNVAWDTLIGGSDWDRIVSLKATADSGVVVLASTKSFGVGGEDWWIQRYSKTGSLLWEQLFGGSFDDTPTDCEVANDLVYLVGNHYIADSAMHKGVVYFLDLATGAQISSDTLELVGNSIVHDINIFPNSINFSGGNYVGIRDSSDMMMGTITPAGQFDYIVIEDRQGFEEANCFTPSLDSSFLYLNKQAAFSPHIPTYPDGEEDSKVYSFYTNYVFIPSGSFYCDYGEDKTENIIATNDGGFAYIGYQEKYTDFKAGLFLVKIGPNGEAPPIQNPNITNIMGASLGTSSEIAGDTDLSVYPNPFSTQLSVNLKSDKKIVGVYLYDAMGGFEHKLEYDGGKLEGDFQDLAPGVYYLHLVLEEGEKIVKVVKD